MTGAASMDRIETEWDERADRHVTVAAAITFETWSAFAYGQRLKKLRQKWGIE